MRTHTITYFFFFFFNDTATTEIYTLSLHDALPISPRVGAGPPPAGARDARAARPALVGRRRAAVRCARVRAVVGRPPPRRRRHGRARVRIAVLSPVWFPVPPSGYGGIEWVVWLLADGLADAGHDVTLFASGDSRTKARLDFVYPEAPSELIGQTFPDLRHVLNCFVR